MDLPAFFAQITDPRRAQGQRYPLPALLWLIFLATASGAIGYRKISQFGRSNAAFFTDYFALAQYSEDYDYGEETVWMTYWHRPLQDVINTFIDAGFRIKMVTEPPPAADTPAELLPTADGRSFICFLFFELEAP